jgi:hypothetical protein
MYLKMEEGVGATVLGVVEKVEYGMWFWNKGQHCVGYDSSAALYH